MFATTHRIDRAGQPSLVFYRHIPCCQRGLGLLHNPKIHEVLIGLGFHVTMHNSAVFFQFLLIGNAYLSQNEHPELTIQFDLVCYNVHVDRS